MFKAFFHLCPEFKFGSEPEYESESKSELDFNDGKDFPSGTIQWKITIDGFSPDLPLTMMVFNGFPLGVEVFERPG